MVLANEMTASILHVFIEPHAQNYVSKSTEKEGRSGDKKYQEGPN